MKKYFVFIFAFAFLLVSYIPNIYEASVTNLLPNDRVMIWGEHIYTYDYNVYLSKIRQGQEARWSVIDKYDNNPQQKGVFLQMIYLLSGKLTAPLHLSLTLTFHLLRTVASFLWIYTIIYLSVFFLKKPALYTLGVIFSLLTTGFPVFYRFENSWWVGSYMSWWQEMDIVKRISFLPHDTFNYIFISIFTILLYLINKTSRSKYFWFLCLLIFFSVFIHPSAAVVFFFSWMIYYSIKVVWSLSFTKKNFVEIGKKTVILGLVILLPLLYIKSVTATYPWKSLTEFDKIYRLSVNVKEYILALGLVFFTGLAGIIVVLIKKHERLLSVATWFLGAWVAIFIFKLFPDQSELRFIQTANHIPLAILSVYFLEYLLKKGSSIPHFSLNGRARPDVTSGLRTSQVIQNGYLRFLKLLVYIIIIYIVLMGTVMSYFSVKAQNQFIHQRAVATIPLVPYPSQVMYPLKDFYNGIKWLEMNSLRSSIVLSKYTAGNYIPAYSGNFVYFGHNPESPHFDERSQKVEYFFSGAMSPTEAYKFLQTEKINYVFYGPQEKDKNTQSIDRYEFLKPVYQSALVTIFEVKK